MVVTGFDAKEVRVTLNLLYSPWSRNLLQFFQSI